MEPEEAVKKILDSVRERLKKNIDKVEAEERQAWCNRWLAYGLRQGYQELPERDPEIAQLVTATLAGFSPEQPDFVVQQVIDGAVLQGDGRRVLPRCRVTVGAAHGIGR